MQTAIMMPVAEKRQQTPVSLVRSKVENNDGSFFIDEIVVYLPLEFFLQFLVFYNINTHH